MKTTFPAILLLLLPVLPLRAEDYASLRHLWRTETFRTHFMGTYGVHSDIEPDISEVEQAVLDQVAALMAREGGEDLARRYLEKIIKPSDSAVFDFTLANIYFQQDKLEIAAKWYERAANKFPSFLRAHKNLGIVRVRLEKHEEAVASLSRAIGLGARDHVTYGLLAYAHMTGKAPASAETAYRMALMLEPGLQDWKIGLSRVLFQQGKHAEAAAVAGELIAANPENRDFWVMQANAFTGMQELDRAVGNYEYLRAREMAESSHLNSLGDLYVKLGHLDLATESYSAALLADPNGDPALYIRNGEILAARGGNREAEHLVGEIRTRLSEKLGDPQKKQILKLQARTAAALGRADEEQERILGEIVALDGMDGEALLLLGRHYARVGQAEKAYFQFERAANLDDFRAEALMRHGQALVRNKQFKEALPLLQQAQELDPKEDLARFIEQVKRVAGL
jgi:tetratricopeptide (TPR) repeat protein